MDSITSENITNEFLAFNQSQWTSNGSNIYLNSSVGIGTSLPRANLDVYGSINALSANFGTVTTGGTVFSSLNVSGNANVLGNLTVSNLIVTGNLVNVVSNTQFSNSVTINNAGTSTALKVVQLENVPVHTNNVAEFWDYQTLALLINGDGNVGIHTTLINPHAFAVVGSSNIDYIKTINVYSSNAVAASNLYGNIVGSNTIACSSLTLGTALTIANGGTGQTTKSTAFNALSPMSAAGDLIYGGTSGSGTRLATGTTTQLLHGGTTPSWSAVSLTADVSGTLPVGNGGTNLTTYVVGDLLYASGTTALSKLADVATGSALLSGGVGVAPSWGQVGLTTHVTGTLGVTNGGTGLTSTSANYVFAGPTTGAAAAPTWRALVAADVPVAGSLSTTYASGQILYGQASGVPASTSTFVYSATGSGSIGIGTATATSNLYVTGNSYISNTVTTSNVYANAYWSSTPFYFRNRLINADFYIDQRNNASAVTPSVTTNVIDRWKFNMNTGETGRVQCGENLGSVPSPAGFTSYYGMKVTTIATVNAGDYYNLSQTIEGTNTIDFGWGTSWAKPVTISFWVQASASGTYGCYIRNNGTFSNSYTFTYTVNSTNTWEYKTVTIPGPTAGVWTTSQTVGVELGFVIGNGTTYQTAPGSWANGNFTGPSGTLVNMLGTLNSTLYITGVQFEIGSVATSFERRLYSDELRLCQRYYEIYMVRVGGYHTAGGGLRGSAYFRAQKRQVTPVNTIIGSALESTNIGTISVDTSNFTGDSVRFIALITATGDAFGQWKYSTDCEF